LGLTPEPWRQCNASFATAREQTILLQGYRFFSIPLAIDQCRIATVFNWVKPLKPSNPFSRP
jgi:hypothetical protein